MEMSVKLGVSYPAPQSANTVSDKAPEKHETASVTPVAEKKVDADDSHLKQAVQQIEKFVQSVKRNLEFSIDEPSGKVVVKVIASDSGEVIRQIPNEEVLKLANSLNDASSLLFSTKV